MKVTFELNKNYDETLVQIYANSMTDEIKAIIQICSEDTPSQLFGVKEEQLIPIQKEEVIRFFSEDKKTYCELEDGIVQVREALYKLEERFMEMIRISNSEIINPDFIKNLELSLAGTIKVNFKTGNYSYTSRRYMKEFKRRLGL
ncbi:MAG: LytTR family DNA-binding domain-containing protein [Vagococcus sp.]|uniref:LytTR family DNA-binding domain-containing protein n=1 Tax=Vagococcus sp. TaxID=1933889 RepID=UPI002FCB1724